MMVKICGITNRDDALAAAEYGATAIGLNFYRESPRYISPTGAATIAAMLPIKILKVGIFVDEPPDSVTKTAIRVGLDVAQLHGGAHCSSLPVWRALPICEARMRVYSFKDELFDALLLDTPSATLHGGTGQTFRWTLAREVAERTRTKIIIAGGLDESNVQTALAEAQPWGVDICSRIEIEPGRKDRQKMKKFIQAALAFKL